MYRPISGSQAPQMRYSRNIIMESLALIAEFIFGARESGSLGNGSAVARGRRGRADVVIRIGSE